MTRGGHDEYVVTCAQVKRFVGFKRVQIALVGWLVDREPNDVPLSHLKQVHVPDVVVMAVCGNAVSDVRRRHVLRGKRCQNPKSMSASIPARASIAVSRETVSWDAPQNKD